MITIPKGEVCELSVLCVADPKFRQRYPRYERTLGNVIEIVNLELARAGVELHPTIEASDTVFSPSKSTTPEELEQRAKCGGGEYHKVIGYTSQFLPTWGGMNYGHPSIVVNPEVALPFDGVACAFVTLHELGHSFGGGDFGFHDSFGTRFNIMDNIWGAVWPHFNTAQRQTIYGWAWAQRVLDFAPYTTTPYVPTGKLAPEVLLAMR